MSYHHRPRDGEALRPPSRRRGGDLPRTPPLERDGASLGPPPLEGDGGPLPPPHRDGEPAPSPLLPCDGPALPPPLLPSRESPQRGGRVDQPPEGACWPGWGQLYCAFSPVLSLDNRHTVAANTPFFLYVKLQKHAPHKLDVSSPQQYLDPRLQQGTAPCLLNPPSTCVRLPLSSPAWRDGVGHLCASSPTSPFVRSFVR